MADLSPEASVVLLQRRRRGRITAVIGTVLGFAALFYAMALIGIH